MSSTQVIDTTSAAQGVQGPHHHKHKTMSQQVDDMSTAIDNALKAGKLTNDQATAMKSELDDIKQKLGQTQNGQQGQSGSVSKLSDDDRKKIGEEFHDVRKQLFSALNPQASAATSGDAASQLFSKIDANNDGNISKDEFQTFVDNLTKGQNAGQLYGQGGNYSLSMTYSETNINITA